MKSFFENKKLNTDETKSLLSDPRWLLLGLAVLLFAAAVAYEQFTGNTTGIPAEASTLLP
ncbi:MAG: hypothetical protein IT270_01665 [Saprospiraceae bacterium]|nr:hypothetical protein [Saprospiraceae bacterium]